MKAANAGDPGDSGPMRVRRYVWAIAGLWTLAAGVTLTWELIDEQKHAMNIALAEARAAAEDEWAFRQWNAARGGVYAPVDDLTQPSPHLANVPERDIAAPSGRRLTLVDPVSMMRQVSALTERKSGLRVRLTSLTPVDSHNAPDPWEREALTALERGRGEVSSVERIDGESYMRLMRPLVVERSCVQCHVEQGRQEGSIRGGISVAVPMTASNRLHREESWRRIVGYGTMWLLGLCGIALGGRQLGRQIERRRQAERKVQEANELLEQRVAQRTTELEEVNRQLAAEIADRKRAELWLLESEERFRGYFELGLVGMAILSPQQQWIEVNHRLGEMLRYPPEELTRRTWTELTHPEDHAADERHFSRILAGIASGYSLDKRFIRRDGQVVHASISAKGLRRPDGELDSVLIVVQDITGRKHSEDRLRALSSRYEAILSAVPDIIVEVDSHKIVTWTNQAGREFFGDDVLGKAASHYFVGEQDTYARVQPLFNGDESVFYVESWQRRRDGQKRLLGWWCRVLKDAAGNVVGALSTARDITDRGPVPQ